eukprot:CAMPEP_0113875018 /NCGR_PEP_ID=MMETSP0780_2-20120614/4682_1 /TAXON_ID=652834 /ORGANISM="Palpitomonas bilix" /LENGTH=100 /DNA_ID=CAMNT_0000860907 /DNA_START=124 /DNA_END=423 /DNA_ORIENTATION=+ /assembly_acc=CAM_ASM_000599
MSYAKQNGSAASDWAKKRQMQMERARKLREERLRNAGSEPADPAPSTSSRPSSRSSNTGRRNSVEEQQGSTSQGYSSSQHVQRRMEEIKQYQQDSHRDHP